MYLVCEKRFLIMMRARFVCLFREAVCAFALVAVNGLWAASPNNTKEKVDAPPEHVVVDSKDLGSADSFKIWFKVYVDESGSPQSVQILKIRPSMVLDAKAKEKLIAPVRGWTLKPKLKDGKPTAGYVIVAVDYN